MSTTTSARPAAATVPATVNTCGPAAVGSTSRPPVRRPSAFSAAGFRKAASGDRKPLRPPSPADASGRGSRSGATLVMLSASTPTSRSATPAWRRPGSGATGALAALSAPSRQPRTSSSSTGLAWATAASSTRRANRRSSRPSGPLAAAVASGWPLTERTAWANSASAEALIICTELASATPRATASRATPWRHGWWRHSAIESWNRWRHIGTMVRGAPRPSAWHGVQPGTA